MQSLLRELEKIRDQARATAGNLESERAQERERERQERERREREREREAQERERERERQEQREREAQELEAKRDYILSLIPEYEWQVDNLISATNNELSRLRQNIERMMPESGRSANLLNLSGYKSAAEKLERRIDKEITLKGKKLLDLLGKDALRISEVYVAIGDIIQKATNARFGGALDPVSPRGQRK